MAAPFFCIPVDIIGLAAQGSVGILYRFNNAVSRFTSYALIVKHKVIQQLPPF